MGTKTTEMASLVTGPATRIDAATAWQHLQAGDSWRLARLGARTLMYDEQAGYVQFDVRLSRALRVVVKLAPNDTYSVEIAYLRRKRGSVPTYVVLEQVHGLYCDNVGSVTEELAVKWSASDR